MGAEPSGWVDSGPPVWTEMRVHEQKPPKRMTPPTLRHTSPRLLVPLALAGQPIRILLLLDRREGLNFQQVVRIGQLRRRDRRAFRRRRAEKTRQQIGVFVEFRQRRDVVDGKDDVVDGCATGLEAGTDVIANLFDLRPHECPPGGICVSRAVRDHVHGRLDLDFDELGPLNLKNIARPVAAFLLKLDPVDRPPGSHRVTTTAEPVRASPRKLAATASLRRSRRWPLVAAVAAAAIVAASAAWVVHAGVGGDLFGPGPAARPVEVATLAAPDRLAGRPSVAVLPFKNLSADAGHDFFSDGTTEDVITALNRFSNLRVISKSASYQFKDSNSAPADIGRLLNARYLLAGSIRRAGSRVRVGVELTESTSCWVVALAPTAGENRRKVDE
jgi:TolB-like protein